ncbi:MAG: hypothetical protein AB8H86_27425 [Polyangiales bacterium]
MSQIGTFILTRSSVVEAACAGWTPGLVEPRVVEKFNSFLKEMVPQHSFVPEPYQRPEVTYWAGAMMLTTDQPFVLKEMKLGYNWGHLRKGRVAFVGYAEDEEQPGDPAWDHQVYLLEVSDDDADLVLSSMSKSRYARRSLRHAEGLRAYFLLDDY